MRQNKLSREKKWSQSIAVGNKEYVENIKNQLGARAIHREIHQGASSFELRENQKNSFSVRFSIIPTKAMKFLVVCLLFVLLFSGCDRLKAMGLKDKYISDSVEQVLADLEPLQELAKNSKPNPDIYASSYYTPDHPLFDGILAVQKINNAEAVGWLGPFAEKNDPEALFWVGKAKLGGSIYSGGRAYPFLKKAIELGNPYAALYLNKDINISDCKYYLGDRCNKATVKKGRQLLKKIADSGDFNAKYNFAASKWDRKTYDKNFKAFVPLLIEGVKRHKYNDLMYVIRNIDKYAEEESVTPEQRKKLANLVILMSDNHFLPAMIWQIGKEYDSVIDEKTREKILLRSAQFLSKGGFNYLFFNYMKKAENDTTNKEFARKTLRYGYINVKMGWLTTFELGIIFDKMDYGEIADIRTEKAQIEKEAEEFIKNATPLVWIDPMYPEALGRAW